MSPNDSFSHNGTGREKSSLAERHRLADQALSEKYEQLDEKLTVAEEYLRSLHLPQPIYVDYNVTKLEGGAEQSDCLAFLRLKGKWRLCHAKCYSYRLEDGLEPSWKSVAECATDVRLEAIAQLGNLKIEAAKRKEAYVAKVDEALNQINKFLSD